MKRNILLLSVMIVFLFLLVSCIKNDDSKKYELAFYWSSYAWDYGPSINDPEVCYANARVSLSWVIAPEIPDAQYEFKIKLKFNGNDFREYTPPSTANEYIIPKTDLTQLGTYTLSVEAREKTKSLFLKQEKGLKTIKPDKYEKDTEWEMPFERVLESTGARLFEGVLYFATEQNFYAVDPKTGRKLWNIPYSEKGIWITMYPVFDTLNKTALFTLDDNLYCVDLAQHKMKYVRALPDSAGENALTIYRGELYILFLNNGFCVADIETGKIKREYVIDSNFPEMLGTGSAKLHVKPVFDGNVIYLPMHHSIQAIDLEKGVDKNFDYSYYQQIIDVDKTPGVKLWRYPESYGKNFDVTWTMNGTPAVEGDYLYISAGGTILKFNKNTGTLVWKVYKGYMGGPVFYKNMVITGNSELDAGLMALDKGTGNILWKFETKGSTEGLFRLYKNRIYVPASGLWYCIDPDAGKALWYIKGGCSDNKEVEIDEEENAGYFVLQKEKGNYLARVKLED